MKELRLQSKADRRVRLGHNWIFSNEVDIAKSPLASFSAGEIVRVVDVARNPVGLAYVNPHALIAARVLTRDVRASIDEHWIASRLQRALALREHIYDAPFYRLAYGESDGLPGLVIDRYGDVCVVQLNTAGMMRLREPIVAALTRAIAPRGLLLRNTGSTRSLEGLEVLDDTIGDVPEQIEVREGDMTLRAPLRAGQKTGYFYDQRDNRARLRRYVKPGDRVLDVFSYVGAWAVSAIHAGAAHVTCIDASQLALDFARRNAEMAGGAVEAIDGDAQSAMESLRAGKERYDVVVLDPPALIKRRKDAAAGERHYGRVHDAALKLLKEDGYLVSASCSHHLSADRLERIAHESARGSGRRMQLLERHAHAPDHPVHPAMPETEYLKALFLRA